MQYSGLGVVVSMVSITGTRATRHDVYVMTYEQNHASTSSTSLHSMIAVIVSEPARGVPRQCVHPILATKNEVHATDTPVATFLPIRLLVAIGDGACGGGVLTVRITMYMLKRMKKVTASGVWIALSPRQLGIFESQIDPTHDLFFFGVGSGWGNP